MAITNSVETAGAGSHIGHIVAVVQQLVRKLGGGGEDGQVGRSALAVFAIRIASAGIAYFSQVFLARWMGSYDYGIFVYVWIWALIFAGLAPMGLSMAAMRFIPEHTEASEPALVRGFLRTSRLVAVSIATLMAGLAFAVLYFVPTIIDSAYLLPAFMMLFAVPIMALTDTQDSIGRAYGWINIALLPPYILRPLMLLATMAIAYLAGAPMNAWTAVVCAIIAAWGAGIVQTLVLELSLRRELPPGPRAYNNRLWLTTSVPILLVTGFELLLTNTDVIVISLYLAPSSVGIYFAALKTIGLVSFVHFAVGSVIAKRVAALNARGERNQMQKIVREAAHLTFWPTLVGVIGLLVIGKPLLSLFGTGFEDAYLVMVILAVGFLIRATMGPADFVLNMLGLQNYCASILFFTAALNLTLNFIAVPLYGLPGAAAATSVSLIVSSLLYYVLARRRVDLNICVWQTRNIVTASD